MSLRIPGWAKVEVFGHDCYTGFVSTRKLDGIDLLVVSVPGPKAGEVAREVALGAASIFRVTPLAGEHEARESLGLPRPVTPAPYLDYRQPGAVAAAAEAAAERARRLREGAESVRVQFECEAFAEALRIRLGITLMEPIDATGAWLETEVDGMRVRWLGENTNQPFALVRGQHRFPFGDLAELHQARTRQIDDVEDTALYDPFHDE